MNYPYFVPYAGYFRLLSATDVLVLFDCVPFPRRGYVHRNQLTDYYDRPGWLTLPIDKVPRSTSVRDIRLARPAAEAFAEQARRFPVLQGPGVEEHPLVQACMKPTTNLVDYLEETLRVTADCLGLPFNVIRSSSLNIDPTLRGEARVLAIVKALDGTAYWNAPGGRHLYSQERFDRQGVSLNYLDYYRGSNRSILQRLLEEDADDLKREIERQVPRG
ncbi:MAG: WbqC family protein [Pseudomonadota bacterium]